MGVADGLKQVGVLTILRSGSAMLLIRRTKADELQGLYAPIGGHLEPCEAPRDAAIREVREEAGIALADVTFRGILVETSPTRYNWITFIYSAEVPRTEAPPCREGVLEWVEAERLASLPIPATDGAIYARVAENRPFVLDALYDAALRMTRLCDELSGEVLVSQPAR